MRKHYIDNIRTFTVVLVVLYHVVYLFNGILTAGVIGPFAPVQYQDAVQYLLYPWFMALLFLIAGMSAKWDLDRRGDREFFRCRTRKLLVPSTVGLLVFHWIQGYVNMRLSNALEQMGQAPGPVRFLIMAVSGTGVLWFIQMLWLFSCLLVLIRKPEKGRLTALCGRIPKHPAILAALVIPVWGSMQILNAPVIAVYRFGVYGLMFFLGYFLFSDEGWIETLEKPAPFLAAAALGLGTAYTVTSFGQNYAESPNRDCLLAAAYLWCAILAILGCAKRFWNHTGRFGLWMNRRAWGLYIFHYLPLSACGLLLTEYTNLPPAILYLAVGAAAFAGSFGLEAIISRIPVLRWCVLGIRKKEKNHVS